MSVSAAAQTITPTTVNMIEWDLPNMEGAGFCPAAIGALTRRPPTGEPIDPLYYVTRCEAPSLSDPLRVGPSLIQFMPGNEVTPGGVMSIDPGQWTAWNLGTISLSPVGGGDFSPTGGMRLSTLGRAFVRGATQFIRLNLINNSLTRWDDVLIVPDDPLTSDFDESLLSDPNAVSDVAIVERSNGATIDAWSTQDAKLVGVDDNNTPLDPSMPPGFVQRLTVANTSTTASITRWAVDGGAGRVYLGGIVVFQNKVYYAESSPTTLEPDLNRGNSIGVLDPNTNVVKRFALEDADPILGPTISGPLQMTVDATGTVWVLTQSGHLVSLKVTSYGSGTGVATGQMAAYLIPGNKEGAATPGPMTFPVSLSASGGKIGFTESFESAIGLLNPNKTPVTRSSGLGEIVQKQTINNVAAVSVETVLPDVGSAQPIPTENSPAVNTDLDPLGDFIEAGVTTTGGGFTQGILRDWDPDVFWVTQFGGPNGHRLTRIDFRPSTAQVTSAFVTGGGTIDSAAPVALHLDAAPDPWAADGGKANFGFNVFKKASTGLIKGNFNYQNKVTGEHVKSVQILTMEVFPDNSARFTGTCTKNGAACTFDVTVHDNGNPGRGRDTFTINGMLIVPNGDTLNGGNIVIHKFQ